MPKILLTWITGWLGSALEKKYESQGFIVVWFSRDNSTYIALDLTKRESIELAAENIQKNNPDFDIIIHCAGDGEAEKFTDMWYDDAQENFSLNAIWPMYLTKLLLEDIKRNNADVVCIWATIALKWYENFMVYSSAKWWFRWFVENLRLELKNTRCRVIAIYPGWMITQGNEKRLTQISAITGKEGNLQSHMNPNDIAELIYHTTITPKNIEVSEVIINRK